MRIYDKVDYVYAFALFLKDIYIHIDTPLSLILSQ